MIVCMCLQSLSNCWSLAFAEVNICKHSECISILHSVIRICTAVPSKLLLLTSQCALHAGIEALSVQDDTAAIAASTAQDGSNQTADADKKARNLQKKLKQIQQLKEKRDANGANTLTPEQLQKLETEQSVMSELRQLEQS